MEHIMLEPGTGLLRLVTMPEELPTSETEETIRWLAAEEVVRSVEIVANRVLPPLEWEGPLPSGRAGEAAGLHIALQTEQRRWLDRLIPDHDLPFLFGMMTPSEVAARLADEIEDWT
jgi:hypothetical protein